MNIYTLAIRYGDESTSTQSADENFLTIMAKAVDYAKDHIGRSRIMSIALWRNGEEISCYEYSCKSHYVWRERGIGDTEIMEFLLSLSNKLERLAEIEELKEKISQAHMEVKAAEKRLAELKAE